MLLQVLLLDRQVRRRSARGRQEGGDRVRSFQRPGVLQDELAGGSLRHGVTGGFQDGTGALPFG